MLRYPATDATLSSYCMVYGSESFARERDAQTRLQQVPYLLLYLLIYMLLYLLLYMLYFCATCGRYLLLYLLRWLLQYLEA
jgi:hypothetical protein